jgi:hypothetical protein
MKKKIKFSHFESEKGDKVKSLQIYLGSLNIDEWLDDVEVQMDIVDGDIKFTVLEQQHYDKDELKEIQKLLKHSDWDGYEFFDFYEINTNESYHLVGDTSSDLGDVMFSSQNLNNLKSMENTLKKFI